MIYYKYHFSVNPVEPFSSLLQAQLGNMLFESFVDTPDGFDAYIAEKDMPLKVENIRLEGFPKVEVSYTKEKVEDQNWNEEWEKNFDPISIGDCHIRATFHPESTGFKHEIVIDPKMSFGTGHHQTTTMMVQFILEMDLKEKSILDMGAGTAVLAILSKMKGAGRTLAIDIDEWAYENAKENVHLNGYNDIAVEIGGAELLGTQSFDVILANINRNILLNDIKYYTRVLNKGGEILFSGFYQEDIPYIQQECEKNNLTFLEKKNINNWAALKFKS